MTTAALRCTVPHSEKTRAVRKLVQLSLMVSKNPLDRDSRTLRSDATAW